MSDYQFKIYEAARVKERKTEKPMKGPQTVGGLFKESTSTYRIFSRLYCNYVMPDRPIPMKDPVKKDEPPKKGDINDILVQAEKIAVLLTHARCIRAPVRNISRRQTISP